jgi:hypothetical protein
MVLDSAKKTQDNGNSPQGVSIWICALERGPQKDHRALKISTQHQEASCCPSSGLDDSHPDPVIRLTKLEASPLDGDASTDAVDCLLQSLEKRGSRGN